jgi:DNA-binding IclR family transcriptional regulator
MSRWEEPQTDVRHLADNVAVACSFPRQRLGLLFAPFAAAGFNGRCGPTFWRWSCGLAEQLKRTNYPLKVVTPSRAFAPAGSLRESSSVQSVTRAAAILRCFVGTTAAFSLSDLSRQTGLSVSTTHRIAKTLCAEGLLSFDSGSEQYQLGPMLIGLGRSAVASAGFASGLKILQKLSDSTGESTAINIRQGRSSVAILAANSTQGLRYVDEMGHITPLHVTAAGKALLAWGEDSIEQAVKGMGRLERLTARTLTRQAHLVADLRRSVDRGYTVCDEEREDGVRAVGAPILDTESTARAAVGLQGPVFRIPDGRIVELAEALREAAAECRASMNLDRLG